MRGIHIFVFDKVFMQSKYHFLFSYKGSISENNYHKRKEKVSLSQETCSGYMHSLHAAQGGFGRVWENKTPPRQVSEMLAELESCTPGLPQGLWGMPCESCTSFLEHTRTQQALLEKYYCSLPKGLFHKYLCLSHSFIPVSLRWKDHENLGLGIRKWSLFITLQQAYQGNF